MKTEEEKEYTKGYHKGQKDAFGVDRKRVFDEGFKAGQKDMVEKIHSKIVDLHSNIQDINVCAGIALTLSEIMKIKLTPPREDKE